VSGKLGNDAAIMTNEPKLLLLLLAEGVGTWRSCLQLMLEQQGPNGREMNVEYIKN
jgi:hypothetical protein